MGRGGTTPGALRVGAVVVCTLVLAGPALADNVAFEAASSASGSGGTLSFTHTVGTGSNRYLVLGVALEPASASVSSASFGGKPLTRIGVRPSASCRTELWGLVGPASGAQPVQVTVGGSPAAVSAGASSYTGVHQQGPLGPFASHTGTGGAPQSFSVSVAIDAGDFTVDVVCGFSNSGAPSPKTGALQTQRWRRSTSNLTGVGSTQPNITSDGRATMDWTLAGSGTIDWSISTVPLNPAPAPPPPDAGPDVAADLAPDLAVDLPAPPDLAADLAEDSPPDDVAADAEADAGAPDLPDDIAAPDLAPPDDEGEPPSVDVNLRVGCACRAGGRPGGAWPIVVLLVALLWRRRR